MQYMYRFPNVRTGAVGLGSPLTAWFDTLALTYETIMWSPGRTGCHGFLQVLQFPPH